MLFTVYKEAARRSNFCLAGNCLQRVGNTGIPWCFSYVGVPDGLSAALVDDDGLLAAQAAHLEALQGLHAPRLVHRHNVAAQALQSRRHRLGNLSHLRRKKIDKCQNQCWESVTFYCGSGSSDPYLWLMDPDSTQDPTPFLVRAFIGSWDLDPHQVENSNPDTLHQHQIIIGIRIRIRVIRIRIKVMRIHNTAYQYWSPSVSCILFYFIYFFLLLVTWLALSVDEFDDGCALR